MHPKPQTLNWSKQTVSLVKRGSALLSRSWSGLEIHFTGLSLIELVDEDSDLCLIEIAD
jgi:hypothetical protein